MRGSNGERTGHSRLGDSTSRSRTVGSSACGRRLGRQNCPAGEARLLNAIDEEEFLGFSYGFRPGPHPAYDAREVAG